MSDLVTPRQAAKLLYVELDTVTHWCRAGKIPGAFKTPGGQWRIPRTALDALAVPPQTSGPGAPPQLGPDPTTNPPGR